MARETAPRQPRCPRCGSAELALLEFHLGCGGWSSDEWSLHEDGSISLHGDGWSESTPTGRWEHRCEACDYQWKRRQGVDVSG